MDDGQSQSCALRFSESHKGLKEIIADLFRNSGAVIRHGNLDKIVRPDSDDSDTTGFGTYGFTCILQKVVKNSIEFRKVKPALRWSLMKKRELDFVEVRSKLHGSDRVLQRFHAVTVGAMQGLLRFLKLE
jgi:hypothetical protein